LTPLVGCFVSMYLIYRYLSVQCAEGLQELWQICVKLNPIKLPTLPSGQWSANSELFLKCPVHSDKKDANTSITIYLTIVIAPMISANNSYLTLHIYESAEFSLYFITQVRKSSTAIFNCVSSFL